MMSFVEVKDSGFNLPTDEGRENLGQRDFEIAMDLNRTVLLNPLTD